MDLSHFETPQPISVELELRRANVRVTAGERTDTIVRVRLRYSAKGDDLTAAEQTRVRQGHEPARHARQRRAHIPLLRETDIESPLGEDDLSYFLSTIELRRGNTPGMSRWRKGIFLATTHITADAAEYFRLPRDRTVIIGSRIEL
jgi:KUP system potassium uptake protein